MMINPNCTLAGFNALTDCPHCGGKLHGLVPCAPRVQYDVHVQQAAANNFPPLIFQQREWHMAGGPKMIKWSEISDPTDWRTAEQRHADDIMSAVRDIARGG